MKSDVRGVLLWTPGRVVVTVRWLVHRRDMSGGGGVGTRGDHARNKGSGDRVAVDSGAEVCCKSGRQGTSGCMRRPACDGVGAGFGRQQRGGALLKR